MRALGLLVACAITLPTIPAHGQEPRTAADSLDGWDLPAEVAEEVIRRLNDPATDVRNGDVTVLAETRVDGDLAVLEGVLTLAGRVEGSVMVVNGDAVLEPGAAITGDLLVVGGRITGTTTGRVAGELVSYTRRLPYERFGGRFRLVRGLRIGEVQVNRGGSSDFLIATGKSYNRVEGMPIAFGPRLETEGSNPFRLQALAIYRSETGLRFEPEEMGYFVRAEQFIGGHREYYVGATLHSLVDPIEEWHLTDLESGLATFFFHRDYRDHYQRRGWSLFANWEPTGGPYRLQVESRWEHHDTRSAGSPWSLFQNAEPWRPQPVIGEGRLGALRVETAYDTRSSTWNPATGWNARAQLEHAFRVDLARPQLVGALNPAVAPGAADYGPYLAGLVDLRRYNRINADSRLNVRMVAGGSLSGDPLPPQRQYALGGKGSLPGYALFSSDCGARSAEFAMADDPTTDSFYANYGCDAFALFQAEFRGKLSFRFRWDVPPGREDREPGDRVWDFGWAMAPDWALFVDAGRGWAFDERRDESTRVNVGAGLLLERIGLYLAVPVTGGTGVSVFLRLGPRF